MPSAARPVDLRRYTGCWDIDLLPKPPAPAAPLPIMEPLPRPLQRPACGLAVGNESASAHAGHGFTREVRT